MVDEIDGVCLPAAVRALRAAGFDPVLRPAPRHSDTAPPPAGAWIPMPGEDAYAVVTVTALAAGATPGTWEQSAGPDGSPRLPGYRVALHECPYRTRGHGYGSPAADLHTPSAEEVAGQVREWSRWQSTWSVVPAVTPWARRERRLGRLVRSKLDSAAIPVVVDLDPLMVALLDREQEAALRADLDALFPPGIAWRFPRDRTGARLVTRTQVLLRECAPPAHPLGKGLWLVVDGPAPRAEAALTVRLAQVRGLARPHRWDTHPEFWRTGPGTLDRLWGLGGDTTAELAAQVTALLEAGDAIAALDACGVTLDPRSRRLLSGLPDNFELRRWTDRWVANACEVLYGAAPWTWRAAVPPQRRPQRLASLGGFNPSRRPGLFLARRKGTAHLSFDQSASPLVLARARWHRDDDYDLVRHGKITPAQIPMPQP